jgi:prolyl-tRNA synthetase
MRDLEQGKITLARRDTKQKIQVDADADIEKEVRALLATIQNDMLARATARRDQMTYVAKTLAEFEKIMNTQPGFVHADWCGDPECETRIKEIRGTKSRCIDENAPLVCGKCVVCGRPAKHHVIWGIQY